MMKLKSFCIAFVVITILTSLGWHIVFDNSRRRYESATQPRREM